MVIKVIASGSKGNAYLISDGRSQLLLECGIPFKKLQERLDFKIHSVNACLISHEHGDHARCHRELIRRGVPVYASHGTLEALNIALLGWPMEPLETFSIGSFVIQGFLVEHDAAEPFGYYIRSVKTNERLIFVTDTKYVRYRFDTPELAPDYIMCECNYDEDVLISNVADQKLHESLGKRVISSHMSLETCAEFINANKSERLKAVYLLHLSDNNSDAEKAKNKVMALTGVPVYIAG